MSPAAATQDYFSIRELTRMTGLSADVLRVWERRYGFPKPERDDAGARIYSAADVERITLLQRAMQRGHRIGSVITQRDEELQALVDRRTPTAADDAQNGGAVNRIMEALCADDDRTLVWELRYAALNLGIRSFVKDIVAPLVDMVGVAWEQGRIQIRHEHLVSDILTTQLRVMWSSQLDRGSGERVLMATLTSEQHALGLEMVGTYLASLGVTPRSMGPNCPPEEIADAAEALAVDGIALSVSRGADPVATQLNLNMLGARLGTSFLVAVGGAQAPSLRLPACAELVTEWNELERWVSRLRNRAPEVAASR